MSDKQRLAGEYELQAATVLLYPYRDDIWRKKCKPIRDMIIKLANTIAEYQKVVLGVLPELIEQLKSEYKLNPDVEIVPMRYNDAWPRDSVSSVLIGGDRKIIAGFEFNAYGDGLYKPWNDDNTLNEQVANVFGYELKKSVLVLEGGDIAPDGNGTIFAVSDCIVNPNRNPDRTIEEVETELKKFTNSRQIVWIDNGLDYDETGGHVDNVLAFVDSHTIIMSWTDDKDNVHYARTHEIYEQLKAVKDADGNPYEIVKLPVPSLYYRKEDDCDGIVVEEGTYARLENDPVMETYVNFALVNGAVIVPKFGEPTDAEAIKILQEVYKDRDIIPFDSREASLGGGGLHCLTKHINYSK